MKRFFFSLLSVAALFTAGNLMVSCSDSNTEPEPDPKGTLTLKADKSSIQADGSEFVTFTVLYDNQTVTSAARIVNKTTNTAVSNATYKTTEAGTYTFEATYDEVTSNKVTVEAKAVSTNTPVTEYANVPTPVVWQVEHAIPESAEEGVEILVTEKSNNNIKFVCRPGAGVASYRLDVFPLCRLYNSLLEGLLGGDHTKKAEWPAVEEAIRSFVFNSTGSGAYIFSPDALEDYAEHEYDWMNTIYSQAHIVPDGEYVIAAVACYDKDGTEQGEMTLCYVRTPHEELIGSPYVDIQVTPGYRSVQVNQVGNADTHYLYYWCSDESDLMPFIEGYGRKMYGDFMRHTLSDAYAATAEGVGYYLNFGQSADASSSLMATAIGLDENQTPAEDWQSVVFNLKEIPDAIEPGTATFEIDPVYTAATIFNINVHIDKNAHSALFKVLTKADADALKESNEITRKAFALTINEEGWGVNNHNFSWNPETYELTGGSYDTTISWINGPSDGVRLQGDTEYVVVGIARNAATELSDLIFSEPVKTKPLTYDDTNNSDCVMTTTSQGRTSIKVEFNYTYDKHAMVLFQYIEPNYGQPVSSSSTQEELRSYLMTDPFINVWTAEKSGHDQYVLTGCDPGTRYVFAYITQDWNGVFGPVKFAEATTEALVGGENPAAEIFCNLTEEDGELGWRISVRANEDTEQLQYMLGTIDDAYMSLSYLGNKGVPAQELYDIWESACMEYGMSSNNTSAQIPNHNKTFPSVAMCIPYGRDASGNTVQGKLAYVILSDATEAGLKTLEDYYPGQTIKTSVPSKSTKQHPQMMEQGQKELLPAAAMQVKAQKPASLEGQMLYFDMQKLSAHPHAKMHK